MSSYTQFFSFGGSVGGQTSDWGAWPPSPPLELPQRLNILRLCLACKYIVCARRCLAQSSDGELRCHCSQRRMCDLTVLLLGWLAASRHTHVGRPAISWEVSSPAASEICMRCVFTAGTAALRVAVMSLHRIKSTATINRPLDSLRSNYTLRYFAPGSRAKYC